MACQGAAARERSQERSHAAYGRGEPDSGVPPHVAPTKQLHSGTGYNLVIDTEGKIYGTREPFNNQGNNNLLNIIDFEFSMRTNAEREKEK